MADGKEADQFESAPPPKSTAMIKAGGGVHAIVPQSFDDAWRIAQVLAKSGMCPSGIDTPEKVMVAIMAGAEVGMAPFQALQSFAIINNRPTLWGDGMLGVVRRFGVTVAERIEGAGDKMIAYCVVTRPDTKETIERPFSVDDAKAAKLWGKAGPWTTYPKRMLQMRARAWALRDGCADMLRGMHMAEEAQDVEVVENHSIPDYDTDQRVVEKIINPDTGREIDPYSANQLRKKGGKWETMIATMQGYVDAKDVDGLKGYFTGADIQEDLAKWSRTWREAMEQEFERRVDLLTSD